MAEREPTPLLLVQRDHVEGGPVYWQPLNPAYYRVNLYCYPHQKTHPVPIPDVERIYYALAGAEGVARKDGYAMADSGLDEPEDDIECPLATLVRSKSSEGFLEHVEQGIACREASHG